MLKEMRRVEGRWTSILFSALKTEVPDRCHRKDPKLLSHNTEMRRKWNNKDFSRHQDEENA